MEESASDDLSDIISERESENFDDPIENLDLPSYDDAPDFRDEFDRKMRNFER